MTTIGHPTNKVGARRRHSAPAIFAGAAAIAALALFSAAPHVDADAVVAAGPSATAPLPTDDTNFVNDNGQTSGDTFTQNAQDQSTASGAGTP
ncbi:hypothetical protein [Mycobacterium sp. 852002-40037_SCH5390672]|uniref:hypothetical protein n=1 Tax=Mycobacterium sp. 852002-40037_SCH5390672 TaxID=1834089 RepID=UPI000805BE21|nr:hypothetical protein [Mycobacterium sp. 852002-40037_SCH5390672]OBC01324.1 hypothetical protein A5782_19925 [Mycobacterium sp. 852002-40037_SCH5390672]